MKTYSHGCDADAEHELTGEDERRAHDEHRCRRYCPLCVCDQDELQERNNKLLHGPNEE